MTQKEIDHLMDECYDFMADYREEYPREWKLSEMKRKAKQVELKKNKFERKHRLLSLLEGQINQDLNDIPSLPTDLEISKEGLNSVEGIKGIYARAIHKARISFFEDKLSLVNLSASIKLSYLYSGQNNKIIINSQILKYAEIMDIFQKLSIISDSYEVSICPLRFDLHFGSSVDFKDLYILASILKNFGLQSVFFSNDCDNIICVGSCITECDNKLDVQEGLQASQFLDIPISEVTCNVIKKHFSITQNKIYPLPFPDDYPDELYEVEDEYDDYGWDE